MRTMIVALLQDVRYALRALRGSPGFAVVAIMSLALGIGANTAIFSLINSVILKTLPVAHPEDLLQVTMGKSAYFTNPIWEQVRDRQDVFWESSLTVASASIWRQAEKRGLRGALTCPGSFSKHWACTR